MHIFNSAVQTLWKAKSTENMIFQIYHKILNIFRLSHHQNTEDIFDKNKYGRLVTIQSLVLNTHWAHFWKSTASWNEHCPSVSGKESRIARDKIVSQISQSSISSKRKWSTLHSLKDTVYTPIHRRYLVSHFAHAKPRRLLALNSEIDLEELAFPWTNLWLERGNRMFCRKKQKTKGNPLHFKRLLPNTILPEMLECLCDTGWNCSEVIICSYIKQPSASPANCLKKGNVFLVKCFVMMTMPFIYL